MKRVFFRTVLLFLPISIIGFELPVDNPVVIRNFGQCICADTIEPGLVFATDSVIRSAENGRLLIRMEQKPQMKQYPGTLGNALIFIHDDGMQTVYGNLDDTGFFKNKTTIERGHRVGQAGMSGWTNMQSIMFQIVDTKKQVYINPVLLLPALEDTLSPKIQNVFLIGENKHRIPLETTSLVQSGRYELYADISDTMDISANRLNPFRISIFVNGITIRILPFEIMSGRNGCIYLGSTALSGSLLYQKNSVLYLGNIVLQNGKSDIVITARDLSGNEKTRLFPLKVN